jgi:serine/threonine protein kinase
VPIHYENQDGAIQEWLVSGLTTFPTSKEGLKSVRWKILDKDLYHQIQPGIVADIDLAYKETEKGLPLESRHLAIVKTQRLGSIAECTPAWTELEVLRGCMHKNIVDIYGHFAIDESAGISDSPRVYGQGADPRKLVILLEYANAGTLNKEIQRYAPLPGEYGIPRIPESGGLYYMLQICAGLKYLHYNKIVHGDLHGGNILLKYKPDGTKTCMLADFGYSLIIAPDEDITQPFPGDYYRRCSVTDISMLPQIARDMMGDKKRLSPEAQQVLDLQRVHRDDLPKTVKQLLSFPWFSMNAVAPIPKAPTPLLLPGAAEKIGFASPVGAGTVAPDSPRSHREERHDADEPRERRRSSHAAQPHWRPPTPLPSHETRGSSPLEPQNTHPERPKRSVRDVVGQHVSNIRRTLSLPFRRSRGRDQGK